MQLHLTYFFESQNFGDFDKLNILEARKASKLINTERILKSLDLISIRTNTVSFPQSVARQTFL